MTDTAIRPSRRALGREEQMLFPSEVDAMYRLREGTAARDCREGRLPASPRKPRRGRMAFAIHPDDALALYAGGR